MDMVSGDGSQCAVTRVSSEAPPAIEPEAVRGLFRDRGLRCTRQRERIYAALASTTSHPTADEILASVRAGEPGLSLATVYNTLEALIECGLVRRLPTRNGSGPCRFDADVSPDVHIATADGRVLDLPAELSEQLIGHIGDDLLARLSRQTGLPITGVHVELVAGDD